MGKRLLIPNTHPQTHRIKLNFRRYRHRLFTIDPFRRPKHREGIIDIVVTALLCLTYILLNLLPKNLTSSLN